jgi:hypothetical protein
LLLLNGGALLFIVLWLLVGGSRRGYFGGGAASEVDGILLMLLGLFNVAYLLAVFFALPGPSPSKAATEIAHAVVPDTPQSEDSFRGFLRSWSRWAPLVNFILVVFVALYLLVSSDRRGYFQANATEVDMIVLFCVSVVNVGYMGLASLLFSRPAAA